MTTPIIPKTTTSHKRVFPANSPDAYALWQHRTGGALYQFTQHRAGWAVRCPDYGELLLLEVIYDSECGGQFVAEVCPCGGAA